MSEEEMTDAQPRNSMPIPGSGKELHSAGEACEVEDALRSSEARFRSMANSAADAIVSVNSNEEIIFWNKAAEQLFGYSEEEALGRLVHIIIPERYREAHAKAVRRYLVTRRAVLIGSSRELQALRKDGSEFPIELSLSTWEAKEGTFFTGIVRDMTSRHETLAALERSMAEARQRTEELESLIQMVAHDLKSPVITIGGLVRVLKRSLSALPRDGKLDQILTQLESAGTTMEQFLKDLLDGLVLDHASPESELFRVEECVEDVVRRHKADTDERGIGVRIEMDADIPRLLGDRHRITQVVDNLVSNAIRHMGTCDDPKIRIEIRDGGDRVVISVSDNGVGIPPEYQRRIFDRFFRIPKEEIHGGTGLGLAICRKIVEKHGGRIWVDSEPDRGATFVLTLPKIASGRIDPT